MLNQEPQRISNNPIYMFVDSEGWDKPSDRLIFTHKANRWEHTTIGELLNRDPVVNFIFNMGIAKSAELAFYIKNNVKTVNNDTECDIGYHWKGRAIRIGDTEYRHEIGVLYEQKI